MKRALVLVVVLVALPTALSAQSLADIAKQEAERRAAQTQPEKVITNADLPASAKVAAAAPSGAAPIATAPITTPQGQDALAKLRAVQSALAGGANASEFKRYYLDAKIKVDTLPKTAENSELFDICDLYGDASNLMIASRTRSISSSELLMYRAKYRVVDPGIIRFFDDVPSAGLGTFTAPNERERAAYFLDGAAQVLMLRAKRSLSALK